MDFSIQSVNYIYAHNSQGQTYMSAYVFKLKQPDI